MEQVIGDQEAEQGIRNRIEAEYDVTVLQEESLLMTKNLWHEAFPEISENFLDEYNRRKTDKNVVFTVMGDEIQAMLYLAPYSAALRGNLPRLQANRLPCMADIVRVDADLISMAFTREGHRNKGCMKRLLSGALEYQEQMGIPLCFVETDKEEFFRRFGFHYIYDRPQYELNTALITEEMLAKAADGETVQLNLQGIILKTADSSRLLSLAHYVNANLCRHYGFFMIRSASYYERFQKELQSTGGNLFLIMENETIKGYFACEKKGGNVIREAVFEEKTDRERYLLEIEDKKPAVMARIVNLPEMLKHISGNGKITIAIRLADPVISKNNGDFIWYIDENGSHMERVAQTQNSSDASVRPEVTTSIGEFTAFIFEYIKLKQNAKFDNIYLAGPTWMNERY